MAVGLILVLAAAAFVFVTRTQAGHELALEQGLGFLRNRIQGQVEVGGIRSAGLLQGVTLIDVAIRDTDGRPLAEVDSIRASYSFASILLGRFAFEEVELWQPRIVLEQLPGQEELNVVRIFTPPTDESSPAGAAARGAAAASRAGRSEGDAAFELAGLQIRNGDFRIRLPLAEGDSAPPSMIVEAPGGGRMREFGFLDLDAGIPAVRIGLPGEASEEVEVLDLSMEIRTQERPIHLRSLRGTFLRAGSTVSFETDRIWLPDSEFAGTGVVGWGDGEIAVQASLEGTAVQLRDFHWIDPRLPDAGGAFDVELDGTLAALAVRLPNLDLILDDSRVQGFLGLRTGYELRLVDTRLLPQPLDLRHVEAWLQDSLPVRGQVRGELVLDGTLDSLRTEGDLTLRSPDGGRPPSRARIDGILHLGDRFGGTNLVVDLDPFHFALLSDVNPDMRLSGPGAARIEVTGRLGDELRFDARVDHRPFELPHSTVRARGTLRGSGNTLQVDVMGEAEPLSFTALTRYYPDIPIRGEVSGSFEARGPVTDLELRTRLATPGGVLALEGRVDALDPVRGYRIQAQVEEFEASSILTTLPAPTLVTGRGGLEGEGFSLESLAGDLSLELGDSRVGHLKVDTAFARARIDGGVLTVDSLFAGTSVMDIRASGDLAVADQVPDGEIRVEVVSDSLGGLRPFLLGDTVIAGDTLSAIERSVLELQGVNPDTLPDEEAVTMSGRLRGGASLRGSVRDFSAQGSVRVDEVTYGTTFLKGFDMEFEGRGLPGLGRRIEVSVVSDSVRIGPRNFQGGELTLSYERPRGNLDLLIRRNQDEDYRTRAAFEVDSMGGVVNLDQLVLRFEPIRWNLGGPAVVSWDEDGVTVQDFRLIRPGEDRLRIVADGRIPFQGAADFRVAVDSLKLDRLGALAQARDTLRGTLGLRLNLTGTAAEPVVNGTFSVLGMGYQGLHFSLVQGGLRYRDQVSTVGLLAWQDEAMALTAEGTIPMNLAFSGVEGSRLPDEEMDLRIRTAALPAAGMLGFLDALEDVSGAITGDITIAGTVNDVSPSGSVRLVRGGASLPALGVRYADVEGDLQLSPDGAVAVDLQARSGGRATVTGTVTLNPATDPTLDLEIRASDFLGVRRRDVEAHVGGRVSLSGSYRRPLLEGEVTVNQGTLFLDEFARGAQVVDLSDPAFFDVVDTSLVAVQPLLGVTQNPFLSNLRVDVDLVVERDSWIRSPDINAELSGELTVAYDRTNRDLALVGTLQAIRGSYNAFGRRFEVRSGAVEFVGTPGLNPSLDIQAATRLRRPNQEPLNIIANVEGTLVNPRVNLTSDAQPAISQSDLVSYLIFGRPSNLLSQGERSVAGGAGQLLGGIAGAASSIGLGTLTSQLSSAVTSEIGFFDYFAITTGQDPEGVGGGNVLTGSFAQSLTSAQVEVGRYFFEDVFVAVLLRPLTGFATSGSRDFIPGARLEWRFTDLWTVEGFVEDRFARNSTSGFGDLGFQTEQIFGMSLFREWGY